MDASFFFGSGASDPQFVSRLGFPINDVSQLGARRSTERRSPTGSVENRLDPPLRAGDDAAAFHDGVAIGNVESHVGARGGREPVVGKALRLGRGRRRHVEHRRRIVATVSTRPSAASARSTPPMLVTITPPARAAMSMFIVTGVRRRHASNRVSKSIAVDRAKCRRSSDETVLFDGHHTLGYSIFRRYGRLWRTRILKVPHRRPGA
ncbi:hypothetical protein [Pinisolibacter aquiterrae]|uniref:hypothetical protein n=1 Tax=Pinisolibacter aquiterrae TaxID=2815579 RepID=UPI001C3C8925|nr:hypothetical protein [Pinisolibacter aquiterrae]MBV5266914.1 hypothetical protein [Pinisolibacter aquiterrae]MCC8234775.1 hypothetical protein [Pinisolibacter aquiterrae]